MMATTHVAAGLAVGAATASIMHCALEPALVLITGGVLGAFLPDIDHPKSAFGSKVRFLSLPISAIFGHRGITHSLFAIAAMFYGVLMDARLDHSNFGFPLVLGIAWGYISHLVGDFFTNTGIPLLWPWKRRFVSPIRFFTGDALEHLVAMGFTGIAILFFMKTV